MGTLQTALQAIIQRQTLEGGEYTKKEFSSIVQLLFQEKVTLEMYRQLQGPEKQLLSSIYKDIQTQSQSKHAKVGKMAKNILHQRPILTLEEDVVFNAWQKKPNASHQKIAFTRVQEYVQGDRIGVLDLSDLTDLAWNPLPISFFSDKRLKDVIVGKEHVAYPEGYILFATPNTKLMEQIEDNIQEFCLYLVDQPQAFDVKLKKKIALCHDSLILALQAHLLIRLENPKPNSAEKFILVQFFCLIAKMDAFQSVESNLFDSLLLSVFGKIMKGADEAAMLRKLLLSIDPSRAKLFCDRSYQKPSDVNIFLLRHCMATLGLIVLDREKEKKSMEKMVRQINRQSFLAIINNIQPTQHCMYHFDMAQAFFKAEIAPNVLLSYITKETSACSYANCLWSYIAKSPEGLSTSRQMIDYVTAISMQSLQACPQERKLLYTRSIAKNIACYLLALSEQAKSPGALTLGLPTLTPDVQQTVLTHMQQVSRIIQFVGPSVDMTKKEQLFSASRVLFAVGEDQNKFPSTKAGIELLLIGMRNLSDIQRGPIGDAIETYIEEVISDPNMLKSLSLSSLSQGVRPQTLQRMHDMLVAGIADTKFRAYITQTCYEHLVGFLSYLQDVSKNNNPFRLYAFLQENNQPVLLQVPLEEYNGQIIDIHSDTFQSKGAQKRKVFFQDLPSCVTPDIPQRLLSTLQLTIEQASSEEKLLMTRELQAMLRGIQRVDIPADPEACIESLIAFYHPTVYVYKLMHMRGKPEEELPDENIYKLYKIFECILGQPSIKRAGEAFSLQDQYLILAFSFFQLCKTNQKGDVDQAYALITNMAISEHGGEGYIQEFIRKELLHAIGRLAYAIAPDNKQGVHDRMFLQNLLAPSIGLAHSLEFDLHTNCIDKGLFTKTKEELLEQFYKEFFSASQLADALRSTINADLRKEGNTLYLTLSPFFTDAEVSSVWEEIEETKEDKTDYFFQITKAGCLLLLSKLGYIQVH